MRDAGLRLHHPRFAPHPPIGYAGSDGLTARVAPFDRTARDSSSPGRCCRRRGAPPRVACRGSRRATWASTCSSSSRASSSRGSSCARRRALGTVSLVRLLRPPRPPHPARRRASSLIVTVVSARCSCVPQREWASSSSASRLGHALTCRTGSCAVGDRLLRPGRARPSPVQHFWSLSVEEQFYLVWPLLVVGRSAGRPPRRVRAC